MRFFVISALLLLSGCKSDYKLLQRTTASSFCQEKIKNYEIPSGWYSSKIDVYNRRISGLLLVKKMEDSTFRCVFTNEAGITFFDFEFTQAGGFTVKKIIKQLDRKPVINTLEKDFALLLGLPFRKGNFIVSQKNDQIYYGVKQKKETAYFITDKECASLQKLELGSDRKQKVTIEFKGSPNKPDSVTIVHHTFDMVISLTKIERE